MTNLIENKYYWVLGLSGQKDDTYFVDPNEPSIAKYVGNNEFEIMGYDFYMPIQFIKPLKMIEDYKENNMAETYEVKINHKFGKEIESIKDKKIRSIVYFGLFRFPSYFYHVPASSTGKYHPKYASGDGGLYRHVKAVVMIARELFNNNQFKFSQIEKDIIIASLILHDGWKQGEGQAEGSSLFEHPTIGAKTVWRYSPIYDLKYKWYLLLICLNIASHMGQWNYDKKTKKRLLPSITRMQKFVHLCDYIASRRILEVNFD